MRTAILTFEQFHGKKSIGSSRIRGHWIVKHWQEAGADIGSCELFKHGGDYDAVIYQKAYFVEHARMFKGIKILDLCDPDWLFWGYKLKEMIEEVDAITTSSLEIAKFIAGMTDKPIAFIPDRIDLKALPAKKEHTSKVTKVAWYGYAENFPILDSAAPLIKKLGLELIVISNSVYSAPSGIQGLQITNLPWTEEHYLNDIMKADIVINPRFHKGKWKYKSNNKTTLSWALGLPVAHDQGELNKLLLLSTKRITKSI